MRTLQWPFTASLGGSSAVHEKKPKYPDVELAAFSRTINSSRTPRFPASCRTCSLFGPSRSPVVVLELEIQETGPDWAHVRLDAHQMATNSSPSASITGADDLCLCSVCHAMWLSGPYHEHTSTFHPGSASSTPEMAVRRLVVCCPSNLVLTRAQEAEVKRPHRITQYASLGD